MSNFSTLSRWLLLSAGVFVCEPGNAHAQYRYPVAPVYPGYGSPYGGAGGYMAGKAEVMGAYGELGIQQEQARIEREKANQEKLVTKKASLDEMLYEKAVTPTRVEDDKLIENQRVVRMMNSPQNAEITGGKTLNIFLPYVQRLASKGIQGPPIPLDSELVRDINVTVGGDYGPNLGILKNPDNLDWPIVVQGPKQQKLAALLPQAVYQMQTGKLDPKLYRQMTDGVTEMSEELRKKFHKEEISGGDYLTGKRFLDPLDGAIKELGKPGTKKFLDRTYIAKGRNVPELAENMVRQGLTFAPASPGEEAAYYAMHSAFVSYISTAQASSGFQPQLRIKLPTTSASAK